MARWLTEKRGAGVVLAAPLCRRRPYRPPQLPRETQRERVVVPFLQWSDGAFYYAFAHSLAFDRDADLTDQFRFIAFGPVGKLMNGLYYGDYFAQPDMPMHSKVGFGTALLTLPFLLAARLAASLYESCGGPEVHQFAAVYLWAYKLGMLSWSFAGIAAGYALLRRLGRPPKVAAAAWRPRSSASPSASTSSSRTPGRTSSRSQGHSLPPPLRPVARGPERARGGTFRPLLPLLVGISGGSAVRSGSTIC